MHGWKKALITTTALAVFAMPATGAFAQNGPEQRGTTPLPSQRFSVNKASHTGADLTISAAAVRRIQEELNRLGYNAGNLSGTWDKQTQRAALDFQEAHGLEPTGTIDLSTIAALGLTRQLILNPTYPEMPSSE
jgi:peptidoglycan hydrolase-like protein with peptidoglycan-binding domain